jgi:NAD(P)-dependent dehydrogenase (short-subunit alcohol dehydrogenase family)
MQATQKVLITAGASGIGRAMALRFARQGAKVFVVDIDAPALRALTQEQPGILTSVCDIGERNAVESVIPEAIEALGGLDVLINNAGIAGPTAPLADFDPGAWEQVMNVNLNGTFNVTRMAIPALRQSGNNPCIVIMSSVAGRFGYPNRSAYATSKWGLIGLTKTLSRELGEWGIRVNAILPGAVAGERIDKVLQARAAANGRPLDEEKAEAMKIQSLQRFVDPEDIAALACFLASDAGRSISGQLLPIDNDMQSAS